MNKKDIYEHLAAVYLNTPKKSRSRRKDHIHFGSVSKVFFKLGVFFTTITLVVAFSIIYAQNQQANNTGPVVILGSEINRLGLDSFSSQQKEIARFDLRNINFAKYNALGFSIRKSNYKDKVLVRIELSDAYGRHSKFFIDQLPTYSWSDLKIKVNNFRGSYNRAKAYSLVFIVDDWNSKEDKGALYIDNIRLLK